MDLKSPDRLVKFKVSLSNGETFYEGKGDYKVIPGERSPLGRLLDYIDRNELDITSLSLFADNGQEWHLPSRGKNPKFQAFDRATKPVDYTIYRVMGADVLGDNKRDWYTVIEADFGVGRTIQLWVNDEPPHIAHIIFNVGAE